MDFCLSKGWSLSMEDEDATPPEFEELKGFVLRRALLDQELASFENDSTVVDIAAEAKRPERVPAQLLTLLPKPVGIPGNLPTSVTDPITDLTKKFEALALRIEGVSAAAIRRQGSSEGFAPGIVVYGCVRGVTTLRIRREIALN